MGVREVREPVSPGVKYVGQKRTDALKGKLRSSKLGAPRYNFENIREKKW